MVKSDYKPYQKDPLNCQLGEGKKTTHRTIDFTVKCGTLPAAYRIAGCWVNQITPDASRLDFIAD